MNGVKEKLDGGPPVPGMPCQEFKIACLKCHTAAALVTIIETAVCVLGLVGCLYSVYGGNVLGSLSTFTVITLTLVTVILYYQGTRNGRSKNILPYLIWKPFQTLIELASLIYFGVQAKVLWNQAVATVMTEEGIASDDKVHEAIQSMFCTVYGVTIALTVLYILVGLVFILIAYKWRCYLAEREASVLSAAPVPYVAGPLYLEVAHSDKPIKVTNMDQARLLPPEYPPAYSEVYAPTVEQI